MDLSEFLEKEEMAERDKKLIEACNIFMASCGKSMVEVYRMEKFTPTLQAKETYGTFYTGDAYVVLKKNLNPDTGEDESYDIHYWHGAECTSDESGSSAVFSVQLSEKLTLKSKHHLEEQNYESDAFMKIFSTKKGGGVKYVPGGIESGWKEPKA